MKCLILAAGYATRLYPLTENFPKPLLKVGDKTILDWLVDDIDQSGLVDQYIVVSNHKFASHFEAWAKTRKQDVVVVDDGTSTNETRLGAVRDIAFVIDQLKLDDDLLIMAGDNLLDFSLTAFIDYAKEKEAPCTLRYYEENRQKLLKSGIVTVDHSGRILNMTEKSPEPESNWVSIAFYYYPKQVAHQVPQALQDGCSADAPGGFLRWVCQRYTSYAMEMPGKRYDIGDLQSYQQVQQEYRGVVR